jgi:hypothetical protein
VTIFYLLFHVLENEDQFEARILKKQKFSMENDPPGPQATSLVWKIPYIIFV